MNYYPVNLDLRGKKVLVVGGGVIAARKVEGLLECDAVVTLISPVLHPDLAKIQQCFEWVPKEFSSESVVPYFLVIAATNVRQVNDEIWKLCSEQNKLVNVVDIKEQCNFIAPGIARCGDLAVTVSTGGVAPFLTRYLAAELRKDYGESFRKYVEILKQARIDVKQRFAEPEKRNHIFAQLCTKEIMDRAKKGDDAWVSKTVKSILDSFF